MFLKKVSAYCVSKPRQTQRTTYAAYDTKGIKGFGCGSTTGGKSTSYQCQGQVRC